MTIPYMFTDKSLKLIQKFGDSFQWSFLVGDNEKDYQITIDGHNEQYNDLFIKLKNVYENKEKLTNDIIDDFCNMCIDTYTAGDMRLDLWIGDANNISELSIDYIQKRFNWIDIIDNNYYFQDDLDSLTYSLYQWGSMCILVSSINM